MRRQITVGLSVLALAGGVGWKLSGHRETSARLQDISLDQGSEHSRPAAATALARVRVRVSPSDFGYEVRATADKVPAIAVATK